MTNYTLLNSIKHTPHTRGQLHVTYAKFNDLIDGAAHAENVYIVH